MEKFVIQVDSTYMVNVDSFVRAICDMNHIGNYYATILVAVREAVEKAVTFEKERQQPADVELVFDYCSKGVSFRVQGAQGCFMSDDFSLVQMLSDGMELSDDASVLQMSFAIRGIDYREAAKRVSVLEHFYHPTPTEMLQM